ATWLFVELIFYITVSPTLWEHNLIELLAPAAACAAAGIVALRGRARIAVAACALAVAIVAPILQGPKGWTGLAGVPRADLAATAAQLRALAPSDALVVAPLEIAAEANRRTPIHYPEIEGLVRMAERAEREGRFGALLRQTRRESFIELHQRA